MSEARLRFPQEGSVDGTPRFEHFESGPLAAVIEYFSRDFDGAPDAAAGVKFYVTVGSFFPAMVFYAMRVRDNDGSAHIEVVSFVPHDEYWDVIGVAAHRNSRFSLTDIRVESVLRLRG